jgi:hypothetical protein
MYYIVICGLSYSKRFYHTVAKPARFSQKFSEYKICVMIFSTTVSETFMIVRIIQRSITINVHWFSYKVPVFLVRF